jgi:hypothetical protein
VYQPLPVRRDYVMRAVLAFVLYYLGFYIVGLVTNLVFLGEANSELRTYGAPPSGRGCLVVLLWVHLILPILLLGLLAALGVFTAVHVPFVHHAMRR